MMAANDRPIDAAERGELVRAEPIAMPTRRSKPRRDPAREPEQRAFGARVRAARTRLGRSQAWLGRQLTPPVTYVAVVYVESGKTVVSLDRIHELARVLRVPAAYLLGVEAASAAAGAPDSRTVMARLAALEADTARLRAQIGAAS